MLFGNLNLEDMMLNESLTRYTYGNNSNTYGKKNVFSKLLTTLSHYGMLWDEDVLKNMKAIPQDKSLLQLSDLLDYTNMYGQNNVWNLNNQEEKNFFEKEISEKLKMLRRIAMQPELENILDIMADESIVYDDDFSYIANPFIDTAVLLNLNEESADEIRNAIDTNFYRIYDFADWHEHAWHLYKQYLIEGVMAYEILYDDIKYPKNVVGLVQLDPTTLTKVVVEGITYWVQYKGVMGKERTLIDAQIIYIKYEDTGVSARQSYLERLIRPFNIYRIVELAQIIWTVTQASFKTIFTIPVGGMNKAKGMQTLNGAMNRYKEDIKFNVDSGELSINGKVNQIFNKEYWFPENASGTPKLETLVDNGPQINDNEQLKYFKNDLYKVSKIPLNRFDNESQSTWFGSDPTLTLREEIEFSRFVQRARYEFAKIILKPLRILLALTIPGLKNDKRILNAIKLRFNTYNQFEEMMNIEIDTKRIEFIGQMSQLTVKDSQGQDVPYFSNKFLIQKYLKMADADIELNEKYKLEQIEPQEDGLGGGYGEQDLGGDFGAGAIPDTATSGIGADGTGIDMGMLGDVQPEGPETTMNGGGVNSPSGGIGGGAPQGPSGGGIGADGTGIDMGMLGDVQPI